jgi:hypothetical protein
MSVLSQRVVGIVTVAICQFCLSSVPAAAESLPLEPTRNIHFSTDEGTWISTDVSPDGRSLVFDLLGDLYLLPMEGGVVDTMVYGISVPIQELPSTLSAVGMFFVQSVLNFFIPSGSGQAYVTMPIMAPLADIVGVERQVAVLALQFGDGFSNILIPTQYVLIGILAMAGIPYDRWLRFIMSFMIKVGIVGSLTLVIAVLIGYE